MMRRPEVGYTDQLVVNDGGFTEKLIVQEHGIVDRVHLHVADPAGGVGQGVLPDADFLDGGVGVG